MGFAAFWRILQAKINAHALFRGMALQIPVSAEKAYFSLLHDLQNKELTAALLLAYTMQKSNAPQGLSPTQVEGAMREILEEMYEDVDCGTLAAFGGLSPEMQGQVLAMLKNEPRLTLNEALAVLTPPTDDPNSTPPVADLPAWVQNITYFGDINQIGNLGFKNLSTLKENVVDSSRVLKFYRESKGRYWWYDQANGKEYFTIDGHFFVREYSNDATNLRGEVIKYYDPTTKTYIPFTPKDYPKDGNAILQRYGSALDKFGYIWGIVVVNTATILLGTGALMSADALTANNLIQLYVGASTLSTIEIARYDLQNINDQTRALFGAYDEVMKYLFLAETAIGSTALISHHYLTYRQLKQFRIEQERFSTQQTNLKANKPAEFTDEHIAELDNTVAKGQKAIDEETVYHDALTPTRNKFPQNGEDMTGGLLEKIPKLCVVFDRTLRTKNKKPFETARPNKSNNQLTVKINGICA